MPLFNHERQYGPYNFNPEIFRRLLNQFPLAKHPRDIPPPNFMEEPRFAFSLKDRQLAEAALKTIFLSWHGAPVIDGIKETLEEIDFRGLTPSWQKFTYRLFPFSSEFLHNGIVVANLRLEAKAIVQKQYRRPLPLQESLVIKNKYGPTGPSDNQTAREIYAIAKNPKKGRIAGAMLTGVYLGLNPRQIIEILQSHRDELLAERGQKIPTINRPEDVKLLRQLTEYLLEFNNQTHRWEPKFSPNDYGRALYILQQTGWINDDPERMIWDTAHPLGIVLFSADFRPYLTLKGLSVAAAEYLTANPSLLSWSSENAAKAEEYIKKHYLQAATSAIINFGNRPARR